MEKEYENLFSTKYAQCRQITSPQKNYYFEGNNYYFKTIWKKIPTEKYGVSYYVLQLPEFAVPSEIRVFDTEDDTKEFKKNVFRDDEKNRFIVYLECSSPPSTSSFGIFNFNLHASFKRSENEFKNAVYKDSRTVEFYVNINHYEWLLPEKERKEIKKYFTTNNHYNEMGDQYNINQAGAVAPYSSSNNNVFNQVNYTLPDNTNFELLGFELSTLRQALISKASLPVHFTAISEVANAEEASKNKDGNKVVKSLLASGKWVLDTAKDIGVDVVSEIIKKQMGVS